MSETRRPTIVQKPTGLPPSDGGRKERERTFHNEYFTTDSRRHLSKYYSLIQSSQSHYVGLLMSHSAGRTVLEYGCGPGSYAFHLLVQSRKVMGIDISDAAIARARQRRDEQKATNAEFCVMDAEHLGFPAKHFGLICGRAILHHLDLSRALPEIARTLADEGLAVFNEPLGHNPFINLYRKLTPSIRTIDEHPLVAADFATMRRHFRSIKVTSFHLSSFAALLFFRTPLFPRVLRMLDRVDKFLFNLVPGLRRHAWSCTIELAEPLREERDEAVADIPLASNRTPAVCDKCVPL